MYWKIYSSIANLAYKITNKRIANKVNDYCFNKVQKHYKHNVIQPDAYAIFGKED